MTDTIENQIKALGDQMQQRLEVIADARLAKTDPVEHLEKLKSASHAILESQQTLEGKIPVRLQHFLEQSSYNKALAFIRGM